MMAMMKAKETALVQMIVKKRYRSKLGFIDSNEGKKMVPTPGIEPGPRR